MMNYNKMQEQAINDFLAECIKNNYHCQHCAKNDNGICFFAFQCFMNDMMHSDDDDETYDISDDVDETNYNPYTGQDEYENDDWF